MTGVQTCALPISPDEELEKKQREAIDGAVGNLRAKALSLNGFVADVLERAAAT